MSRDAVLLSLGLNDVLRDNAAYRDASGLLYDERGARIVYTTPESLGALHHVLEKESSGTWRHVCKATGVSCGRSLALQVDRELKDLSHPTLSALPLEAAIALLERLFSTLGWGRLTIDLAHAPRHGLVVARLDHSNFAELLPNANDFVDALPAGVLQSFFEHLSGEKLDAEEIVCRSRGAPHCTFVIGAANRIAAIVPHIGTDSAEAIIARLVH